MTPDDIDWPPPICTPCKWAFHDLCRGWCECLDCSWLYDEGIPPWLSAPGPNGS